MNLPHSFHFQRRILKSNFKKLKTNVLLFAWTFLGDFISIHYTLEKYTGFFLASNWVEDYIVNTNCRYWNGIVPRYIYEIFKPSLRRFSTRSQITFFGPKILSKINHNIKNAKTMPSFMHAIKKSTLLHLQTHANLNNYHILMINVII